MGLTANQEQFKYWITEREKIRLLKEANHQRPWTDNIVMQETYFCNIDREDDRVTRWIRNNWDYEDCPNYFITAMVAARLFNQPSTLDLIGMPNNDIATWITYIHKVLAVRKLRGVRIWNGAYIVSTNGKKMDKLVYCIRVLREVAKREPELRNNNTLVNLYLELMQIDGLGSFLAGQVIADIKNTWEHPLYDAEDWLTFSSPGPGSLRGLSWFFDKSVTNKDYQNSIQEAYDIMFEELTPDILRKLCMQNFQNCFCEYDKFMRVTKGTGRSKRNYNGKG